MICGKAYSTDDAEVAGMYATTFNGFIVAIQVTFLTLLVYTRFYSYKGMRFAIDS